MDEQEQYDGILEDDALAPLKRNHACLQCKKRKVKCDATKPTCSPCMRSHAHAVRAAQRNDTAPPLLVCTYAEGDVDDANSADGQHEAMVRKSSGDKKVAPKKVVSSKAGIVGTGTGHGAAAKIKEKKLEEERDTLKLRIAELEKKLATQTPSTSTSSLSGDNSFGKSQIGITDYRLPGALDGTASNPFASIAAQQQFPPANTSFNTFDNSARVEDAFDQAWPSKDTGMDATGLGTANNMLGNMDLDWDIGGLFMVPANWPLNLPSPFLLEHLIETFFNCVPQIPRMIHKGNLLYRVRLPPTHQKFPHAALLHAICAVAASHTAWVNSLPPEQVEETATRAISMGRNMEDIEDFGLAQAFASRRAMDQSATSCAMGSGQLIFELVQASIILSEVFFGKGMPLQGWLTAGIAPRLIKSLELGNRNHGFKRAKEPMLPPPKTAIEREERIATVWMAHIQDSGFAVNSYWSQSMDWKELKCPLPTSTEEFRKKDPECMLENPQSAHTSDVLTDHPIADTFLLVVKASLLMSRTAKWLQEWHQREMHENDELEGLSWPSFIELVNDIYAYQRTIPAATRNVFRILHQPASGFDSNLLLVHILPNIALCLIHEPFVDWTNVSGSSIQNVQRSYEAVVGMLHLVPSNLDVSLVMTPLLAFSLYTTGRIIANFMQKALDMQSFGLAVRYRADLTAVQGLLGRYGQKHTLGGAMSSYLDNYLTKGANAHSQDLKALKGASALSACMHPERTDSYPVRRPASAQNINSMNNTNMSSYVSSTYSMPTVPSQSQSQAGAQGQATIDDFTMLQNQLDMMASLGTYDTSASAHISPQSQPSTNTPSSSSHPPHPPNRAASGSGSSFSYPSSSKATPESATLFEIDMDAATSQFINFEKGQFTGLGNMPSGVYQGQ